jgi:hypothetical protein
MVECDAGGGLVATVGVGGGFEDGEPGVEVGGVLGVGVGGGQVCEGGGGVALGAGEFGEVAEGGRRCFVVVGFAGGVDGEGVVGASGQGVPQVFVGEAAGEGGDLGEVAEQAVAVGRRVLLGEGVGGGVHVGGDGVVQGHGVDGLVQLGVAGGEMFEVVDGGGDHAGVAGGVGGGRVE